MGLGLLRRKIIHYWSPLHPYRVLVLHVVNARQSNVLHTGCSKREISIAMMDVEAYLSPLVNKRP